jgi:L-ascorbate metabolism protein UlaG (beta-lactamase superfamily)
MASISMTGTDFRRVFPPAKLLDRRFQNPVPTVLAASGRTLHLMRRWMREGRRGLPAKPIGPFPADLSLLATPVQTGLRVTWFGHSSLLIEIDGCRILTDPVWSNRASFVPFAGPKRFYPPSLPLASLPPLDAVLLSHDHYDHLDAPTIRRLAKQPVRFICSLGMSRHLESWGVKPGRIAELNWGESERLPSGCEIIATPARHFSGRTLWGRNRTLWSSFVIRTARHTIFFGGDSGPFPGFREIGNNYGPFDLAMLEIGAYDADWPEVHMGPENATEAHLALRGRLMLPIHWGLFNLAFHPWQEPVERLLKIAAQKQIPLLLPRPGIPVEAAGASLNTGWWAA